MTHPDLRTVKRSFTPESLLELLRSETARSRSNAESRYELTPCPLPNATLYFVGSTATDVTWSETHTSGDVAREFVLSDTELINQLLDDDGRHPWWIDLSPLAVTDHATIFEITHSRDFTDCVFTGADSFPGEPFHLLGPTLPASFRDGDPLPPIVLPLFRIQPETSMD